MYPVYPRWRGEHGFTSLNDFKFCGLSPLARGTLFGMSDKEFDARVIPAGAGNTLSRVRPVSGIAVYPRWRGEHALLLSQIRESGRFIPAGAGNTEREGQTVNNAPVYPRWRGEHIIRTPPRKCWNGLSPLARGTRDHAERRQPDVRFIPAGAGNTITGCLVLICSPVYPRWRGEHPCDAQRQRVKTGLSPLARGTLK